MANQGRSSLLLVTLTTVALLLVTGCQGFFVDPVLTGITITPATPSITVGSTQQMVATGTFNDGSTGTITTNVTWSTSNSNVATVSTSGLVTGVVAGTATITAASGTVSASTTVTVVVANLVSIAVNPTNASITKGASQSFTATGTLKDGSTVDITNSVTWKSSNGAVATIDNTGRATALAAGTTNITATSGTIISNAATLNVT